MDGTSVVTFFRKVWGSGLPVELMRGILVAALFEALLYLVNARIRRALGPALARDAGADNAQRIERRRIVLGVPLLLARVTLYAVALLIVLRIFQFRANAELYPVAFALLVLAAVGGREALRDAVAGYLVHYDYLFKVGDEVTVGPHSGMVSEVGLRRTRLRTRDGQEIAIGNAELRSVMTRSATPKSP
jgi:small conductance mechanosensitive channel